MSHSGPSEAGPSPYGSLSPMDEASGSAGSVPQVSSTESQHTPNPTTIASGSDSFRHFAVAQFEKQPPDNMRKSNFFNFVITLFDGHQQPVEIQKATFKDFYDTVVNGQEFRNGLIYKLNVVYSDGIQREEELYVRLIDSHTKQMVPYEGTSKNPDFRRVLLTHELICSRCLEHRSCGNKNDTPSDPIVIDRFHLKFFVKCNQNCLKNAGNPKDSRRRFQVALYSAGQVSGPPIACSEAMFVHNNSKHGRRPPPFREAVVGDGKPYIIAVYPNEGWISGGSRVCIVGMNFFEGIEVVFGTLSASSEVLSPNAIAVKVPQSPRPGEVDITLIFKGSQFCINNPGKFLYLAPNDNSLDHNFSRLERLLRNHDDPEDIPKDILLRRAADALETFFLLPRAQQTPTGPLSHISPFHYPHSPALFAPAILPVTSGTFHPRFNPALISPGKMNSAFYSSQTGHHGINPDTRKVQSEDSGSVGYPPSNPVSRCSSSETLAQNQQAVEAGVDAVQGQGVFTFPIPPNDSDMKPDLQQIHKPKPLTPGPMYSAMPYIQVAPHMNLASIHGLGFNFDPNAIFMDGAAGEGGAHAVDHSNRNNNNSTHEGGINLANLAINPIQFIPRIVPALPPSPGYFMNPSASPGPLPATPTGPSGSVFNFSSPPVVLSPGKSFRPGSGKGPGRPVIYNFPNSEGGYIGQNPGILNYLAALPSPSYGSFFFPPVTPPGFITPISIADLPGASDTSTTVGSSSSSTSQQAASSNPGPSGPPPAKKPKTEGSVPTTSQ